MTAPSGKRWLATYYFIGGRYWDRTSGPCRVKAVLVGESGSGKSVTAMSVLNLLPDNAERTGKVLWKGKDLLQCALPELQALRGREIACVFQDPMSSLNPVFNIGQQLCEPLMKHLGLSGKAAIKRAEELLAEVGIPEPKRRLSGYPHEMSGGQQQPPNGLRMVQFT